MVLPPSARFLYLLVFLLVAAACQQSKPAKPPVVTRGYYYWRNKVDIREPEKQFLQRHAIRKLYAKCLDIDWSDIHHAYPVDIVPVHRLSYGFSYYHDKAVTQVIPVVFITNKTFQQIDSAEVPMLATHVLRKCIPDFDSLAIQNSQPGQVFDQPTEIQFDCDWSAGTKNKYFYFLQEVRRRLTGRQITLSATIRLHQYKYPSLTGVPPVDRGMLMVYNVSKPTAYAVTNSIFDYDKARAYFTAPKPYPLKLDMALPAYAWGIVFRNGSFLQIVNNLNEDTLRKSAFLRYDRPNFYKITADTVFYDLYLRPGDEIRIEQIDEKTLLQAAQLAAKAINTDSLTVSLFELSEHEISNYQHETIDQVYDRFGH